MGDRAVIVFKSADDLSPAVYLHSKGSQVQYLLEEALPTMRTADVDYSCARFIGVCHDNMRGNHGLGVFNTPELLLTAEEAQALDDEHGAGTQERDNAMRKLMDDYRQRAIKHIKSDDYSHGDAGVFLVDVDTWLVECYNGYGLEDGEGHCSKEPLQLNAELVSD